MTEDDARAALASARLGRRFWGAALDRLGSAGPADDRPAARRLLDAECQRQDAALDRLADALRADF